MNSRENTLEVLFYLFENYQEVDDVNDNKAALHTYLQDAGFPQNDISNAFDWLESLADESAVYINKPRAHAFRVFSKYETRWLNQDCINYLIYLEHSNVLDHEMRERAIDKILALKDRSFDLNKLKWVVLMLLLNQPDTDEAYAWMDDVALGEQLPVYH